eukprot:gene2209-2724_t
MSVLTNILNILKTNQVIPNVLKESFAPIKELNITWGAHKLNIGEVLTPTQVQNQPEFTYEANSNEFYTIIFTDPDAPTRSNPIRGEWRHMVITNIPGNKVSEGDVMAKYVGSGPPENSGLHRYVFILCKQPSKIHFKGEWKLPLVAEHRNNTKAMDLIEKWNLEPQACNFYQAEYDSYVPKLYQILQDCKEKPVLIE